MAHQIKTSFLILVFFLGVSKPRNLISKNPKKKNEDSINQKKELKNPQRRSTLFSISNHRNLETRKAREIACLSQRFRKSQIPNK